MGETDPATGASVCARDPSNSAWYSHQNLHLDVPNFHRVVVHGSGYDPVAPMEWLKLTVDPEAHGTSDASFGPFIWERKPQPQLLP